MSNIMSTSYISRLLIATSLYIILSLPLLHLYASSSSFFVYGSKNSRNLQTSTTNILSTPTSNKVKALPGYHDDDLLYDDFYADDMPSPDTMIEENKSIAYDIKLSNGFVSPDLKNFSPSPSSYDENEYDDDWPKIRSNSALIMPTPEPTLHVVVHPTPTPTITMPTTAPTISPTIIEPTTPKPILIVYPKPKASISLWKGTTNNKDTGSDLTVASVKGYTLQRNNTHQDVIDDTDYGTIVSVTNTTSTITIIKTIEKIPHKVEQQNQESNIEILNGGLRRLRKNSKMHKQDIVQRVQLL